MKVPILVVVLLAYCKADNSNFFQNYLRLYLNDSINPCDDFFGHVCSAAPENEHYIPKKYLIWNERIQPHFSDHCLEIIEEIAQIGMIQPTFPDNETKLLEIRKTCSEDPLRCKKIAKLYSGKDTETVSKDKIVEIVFDATSPHQRPRLVSELANFASRIGGLCAAEALFRKIDADAEIYKPLIEEAETRMNTLVNKLKMVLIKRFKDTKWMQNSGTVKKYQMLIANINRMSVFNESYRHLAQKFTSHAKECSGIMFGWHPMEIYGCMFVSLSLALKELSIGVDYRFLDTAVVMNAGYMPEKNLIGDSAILTLQSLAGGITELGTAGFILAHELAHSIYNSKTNISSLSIENIDCIYKHRQEVCNQSDFVCEMGNLTITEDAPDITALATILDLLELEKDTLGGNPVQFSKEQYLFYTIAATFCTKKLDHAQSPTGMFDNHSPRKGRFNALLMHSQIFQESFSCKPGDGMWREPDHFCHLLGPDADRR